MLTIALFVCLEVILVQAENHPVMLVLMASIQIDTQAQVVTIAHMQPMELLARQQLPRHRHHRRLQPLLVILVNLSLVSTLFVVKPVMLENTQTHPQPRHASSVWLANMPTTLDQPFAQIAQWGTRHLLVHLYARNVNQENTPISRGLAVAFCVLRVRTLKTLRRA
jgi:hypothetical protein